jgi:tetratricopeptide (TPR) repeat protein
MNSIVIPRLMIRYLTMFPIRNIAAALALVLVVVLAAGCSAKAKTARHLARADRYYQAQDYQKAEVEYLNVLQSDRANPRAIGRLGVIYYEQGRIGRAFAFLTRFAELSPGDLDARLKLATINLAAGKVRESRAAVLSLLDQSPTNAEAILLLADSAATTKDLPEVRQRLEQLSAQQGETAPLRLASGILHLREQNFKEAEADIKRALVLDPKFGVAYSVQGSLRLAQGDAKGAGAAFKTAAELSLPRSIRRMGYAEFKIQAGQLEEGKALLAQISRETPDYLPAWIRQAGIALTEKKYQECASLLNQVLSRDDSNFEALLLDGRLAVAQRDAPKALARFERLAGLFDRSPQVYFQLAIAQLLNNDLSQAVHSLERAVALNPDFPEAILALAEINLGKGEAAPAIEALTALLKQHPQIAQAHLLLANAFLAQKKPGEAVAVIGRMKPLFPKDPQVPFLLGTALIEQKQLPAARQEFETSLELSPGYLPALQRLVDLDLLDKQFANATARVKQEMERNPASADLWLLLGRIHLAQKATDPAETALLKAIELNPNLREPYFLLARLYRDSNRQPLALRRLNELVAKNTNDVPALMLIGMIQDGLKDPAAARTAYEKILAVNPNFSLALNCRAILSAPIPWAGSFTGGGITSAPSACCWKARGNCRTNRKSSSISA